MISAVAIRFLILFAAPQKLGTRITCWSGLPRECEVKSDTDNMTYSSLRILSLPGKDFRGNPYIQLFCESLERSGMLVVNIHTSNAKRFKFDILHLHWPEFYVTERPFIKAVASSLILLCYMLMTKIMRKKIVWSVHDVAPMRVRHVWLLDFHLLCVRVLVDGYIFMNPSSEVKFTKIFPRAKKKPAWNVPHGPYPVSAISPRRRAELRERLSGGADCVLVGFLGDIRPHKNAEVLAYLPHQDSIGREVKIIVAGAADPTYDTAEIEAPFSRIPRGRLVRLSERLTDQKLADIIRAVDVVLLPYLRGSNSGFSMLVLSCGQRLLCSGLPMFRDLANRLGRPWVSIFDHRAMNLSKELETALSRFQHDMVDTDAWSRLRDFLDDCSFDSGAQKLHQFYQGLIS